MWEPFGGHTTIPGRLTQDIGKASIDVVTGSLSQDLNESLIKNPEMKRSVLKMIIQGSLDHRD